MDKKRLMDKARGLQKCQTVFKNGQVINVFNESVETMDIAVEDGIIIGIGKGYEGETTVDLMGRFVAPGFIDGHVHIESSMVSPAQFPRIVVPKGTTTIIADPHEIANVSGVKGIEYMLRASCNDLLDTYFMIPSSVPSTNYETAGATISVDDIRALKDNDHVLGLGEVMNYPAVLGGDRDIHEKIAVMNNRPIDGHAPSLKDKDLNAYILAGVQTDHECSTIEEMQDRLNKGMYVHLREGSVTRNVRDLVPGLTVATMRRALFCTDDKHPEDIRLEGHINHNVNLAIGLGVPPMKAIQMATINAADCYGLSRLGAIAPGRQADFFTFGSFDKIEARDVYKKGVHVASGGEALFTTETVRDEGVHNTVHIDVESIDLSIPLKTDKVKVIGLVKNNITTKKLIRNVSVEDGVYVNNPDDDILKLTVVERHGKTGNHASALVEGFGLKNGALAMTIAHDSHNLVMVGDSDEAMRTAMRKIVEMGGGIVLVKEGEIVHSLPLEISGIMTAQDPEQVAEILETMKKTTRSMGLSNAIDDPFIQLAFLPLAVIPTLKITDRGLFDVEKFEIVEIEESS